MTDQPNLDPARTAPLVMDYQVGLVQHLPGARALLERVNTAVTDVRARGVMAYVAGPDLHTEAPSSQIHASLSPQIHDDYRLSHGPIFGVTPA
jgi:hypothetical protein